MKVRRDYRTLPKQASTCTICMLTYAVSQPTLWREHVTSGQIIKASLHDKNNQLNMCNTRQHCYPLCSGNGILPLQNIRTPGHNHPTFASRYIVIRQQEARLPDSIHPPGCSKSLQCREMPSGADSLLKAKPGRSQARKQAIFEKQQLPWFK